MYNCKYCDKECKNANSLRNHERLCKLNPNRQQTVFQTNNPQKNNPWQSGLSKDTDERLLKISDSLKKGYLEGTIKNHQKNKSRTVEERTKISLTMKTNKKAGGLRRGSGLGKKGDVIALEVNMRPCGGFTPDMINFAHSTNVYKIWADMIAFNESTMPVGEHAYCAFAGRRDGKDFVMDHEAIMEKYGEQMKMVERIPDVLSGAMGNQMYVATFPTKEDMDEFYASILEVH